MRRTHSSLSCFAVGLLLALSASAQSGSDGTRFDVQSFRPNGSPQDLAMVGQSRPLSHLSVSLGLVMDFALDPLVLVQTGSSNKVLSVVGNRLTLDAVASVGLLDWMEIGLAMPLVLSQSSDNLEAIGTEGPIKSTAFGDLRFSSKFAIPGLKRSPEGSGLGAALTFGLSFPTGLKQAFASDGGLTVSPGFIVDYRFGFGLLLTVNGGYWSRPVGDFNGLKLGPMATFGAAVEVPIVRRWGIMALGEFYGSASLLKTATGGTSVPAEALLGLRWYSSTGLTFTVGGGGGCGCSFSSPTVRLFTSVIWVPGITKEYAALERFKDPPPPPVDPDGDGVIGEQDKCPDKAGPVENGGCPDEDRDHDGIVDRLDHCPDKPAPAGHGRNGCPLAEVQGDQIVIADQVYFAFNKDVILDESFPVLDEVFRIIQEHPEFSRIRIEGHTDEIGSKDYNLGLSARRADSVRRYLLGKGTDASRLRANGFGASRPISNNSTEEGRQLNRRVEFHIDKKGGTPVATPEPVPLAPVSVQGNRIVLHQPLRFVANSEALADEGKALMEAVGRLIRQDAQIDRVKIDVHAERSGAEALSLARLRAVTLERVLLEQGVDRKRLRSVASYSSVQNAGEKGEVRELVEFTITLRTDNSKDPFSPRKG